MSNDGWYDAVDHMPYLVCKCLLPNGDIVDGRHVMGDWENMDGEIIYPTHFKIDRGIVETPIYTFTHGREG